MSIVPKLAFVFGLAPAVACHTPSDRNSSAGVRERWFATQIGYGQARPTIAGSRVFFTSGDGRLIARDARRGETVWSVPVSTHQVDGYNLRNSAGVVAVASGFQTTGVDETTGRVRWRYSAPIDCRLQPAAPGYVGGNRIEADDSTFYLVAWGASVSAIDARTGQTRWVWEDEKANFRSGASGARLASDTLYVAVWNFLDPRGLRSEPGLLALDSRSGRQYWRLSLGVYKAGGVATNGAPAVLANTIVVGARGGDTWGISKRGVVLWHYIPKPTVVATVSEPEVSAANSETVVVDAGDDKTILALNGQDGSVIWRAPFAGGTVTDILVTARRVYATNGTTLFIYDTRSGNLVVRTDAPTAGSETQVFGSAPAFSQGHIFVTVSNGAWSFFEPWLAP